MYYKGLISTVKVQTKATVAFIRTKLTNLKGKIKEMDFELDLSDRETSMAILAAFDGGQRGRGSCRRALCTLQSSPSPGSCSACCRSSPTTTWMRPVQQDFFHEK